MDSRPSSIPLLREQLNDVAPRVQLRVEPPGNVVERPTEREGLPVVPRLEDRVVSDLPAADIHGLHERQMAPLIELLLEVRREVVERPAENEGLAGISGLEHAVVADLPAADVVGVHRHEVSPLIELRLEAIDEI